MEEAKAQKTVTVSAKEGEVEPISAKYKRKQRQEAAKKQKEAGEEAEEERKYAEEEQAEKAKGKAKQKAQDRPGKKQKALAPPASDPALRQKVDEAVKQDLDRTGKYAGVENWEMTDITGPFKLDVEDPQLKPGRGVRYQTTFQKPDGSTIDVSVNYDPVDNHFGTIKESSGKPNP
jgi:hypothetical protein